MSDKIETKTESFEEKALLRREANKNKTPEQEPAIAGLQRGKIGKITISRVIVGSNLFGGGAHSRNLKYVSQLMRKYFTPEKCLETLQLCEENGINTNIGNYALVNRFNQERGGNMQCIAQIDPARYDWSDDKNPDGSISTTVEQIRVAVEKASDGGCVGAFLLGCRGDRWTKANRLDLINEFVYLVKKNGMFAGIGGHDKLVPMTCEKQGVDTDFYFKTIHPETYWSAIPKDQRKAFLVDSFGAGDHDCMWEQWPAETIEFMRTMDKPWIGFKVLAAGAVQPSEGFRFAFESGADFTCVGMFDWQVRENVKIAKEALEANEVRNRPRKWH